MRVKLANSAGGTDLLLDALALDSDDFILAGSTCPRVLAPGEACAATIRFAPSATKRRSATLKVRSNAAQFDITLSGEGIGRPAPIVGPAGPTGPAGQTGSTGPAGPRGAIGAAGPAGSTGATGATGATGPAGTNGADGVSVLSASTPKQVVRVKCSRKRCRVTGAPHGRAKLVRKGRVYAAGKLPGKLKTRRAVRPGRYTLKVGHEQVPSDRPLTPAPRTGRRARTPRSPAPSRSGRGGPRRRGPRRDALGEGGRGGVGVHGRAALRRDHGGERARRRDAGEVLAGERYGHLF
jgi:hypothetical protein